MASAARWLRLALPCAGLALAGCSWHPPGAAEAAAAPDAALADPAPGASLAEVIALGEAREGGGFSVDAELERVARVRDGIWEDVPERSARRPDFVPEPGAEYVVVVRRRCRDWEGRERWSDERASWFLLREGGLVAYDHWRFGPRCSLRSALRPVAADSPSRATERDLRRWLDQRHPPGRLPIELRFRRGIAYAEAGRDAEARAALRSGDNALVSREDLFEKREVTSAEAEAFELEGRRLRALREDLRAAIRRAAAPPAAPGETRAEERPAD